MENQAYLDLGRASAEFIAALKRELDENRAIVELCTDEVVGDAQGNPFRVWVKTSADFELFHADPIQLAAATAGVSVAQYRDWMAHHGNVSCAARNKNGRPCRGIAVDGYGVSAAEYVKMLASGAMCVKHRE